LGVERLERGLAVGGKGGEAGSGGVGAQATHVVFRRGV
jgi:hypothetical protein